MSLHFLINVVGIILSGVAVGRHTGSVLDGIAVSCAIYALMPYNRVAR